MLYIVSIGPGAMGHMTPRAVEAIKAADTVIGYKTYLDLIAPLTHGKRAVSTGMRSEVERCARAVDEARNGRRVALVSSGDAGIYGMAGLVIEIAASRGITVGPPEAKGVDLAFEVIPGIPALSAAASLLGAPLMHDFAAVSLSDLLTPWEDIKRRVELAAEADFVIVLYNPKSSRRDWQLGAAREILLLHRGPETPVGIVSRAMREGEKSLITTLHDLAGHEIDMQTIVIVGNSATFVHCGYMVTSRGYSGKYELRGPASHTLRNG